MRGSMAIRDVEELLGVRFRENADETVTTIAGLLSHVSGKVPAPGDKVDLEGYRFEVLEANQRKVLRLRIRKASGSLSGKGQFIKRKRFFAETFVAPGRNSFSDAIPCVARCVCSKWIAGAPAEVVG